VSVAIEGDPSAAQPAEGRLERDVDVVTAKSDPNSMARMRGLDGLRGVAVLSVLFFHAGFNWARGSFLAVSLFFTLSGFLITSLLIREADRSDHIDLVRFWGRRLRRIVPAALLALLFVCLFGAIAATPNQRLDLRGDIWAALANVSNWRFLTQGRSYAALFSDPSPLQHFWSLTIEEQFYLFFPLVVAGCAALAARRSSRGQHATKVPVRAVLAIAAGVLAVVSIGLQVVFADRDRIYYGTDTRMWELLAGVLLACALTGVRIPRWVSRTVAVVGAIAFVVMLWSWSQVNFESAWLYHDAGLAVFAFVDVAVVFGAIVAGPLRAVCSWRPLVEIGLISYGLYLFHWPVYLWLDGHRVGWHGWPLFLVRISVTAALALASFFLVELPIRNGKWPKSWRAPIAWIGGIALVAIVVPLAVAPPHANQVITNADFAEADRLVKEAQHTPVTTSPGAVPLTAPASPVVPSPLSTYVVGDSTGAMLAGALALLQQQTGQVTVRSDAVATCGFVPVDLERWADGSAGPEKPQCASQIATWSSTLASYRPDAILLVSGAPNTSSFQRSDVNGGNWTNLMEPVGRAAVLAGMNATADALERAAPGVPLLWLTAPYTERTRAADGDLGDSGSLPERIDTYNSLIDEVARTHPAVVKVQWGDYFDALSLTDDAALRPDGFHTEVPGLADVVRNWGWSRFVAGYVDAKNKLDKASTVIR
jgi:peptidoglycan/LPS O-acetylase OafA/YrhL